MPVGARAAASASIRCGRSLRPAIHTELVVLRRRRSTRVRDAASCGLIGSAQALRRARGGCRLSTRQSARKASRPLRARGADRQRCWSRNGPRCAPADQRRRLSTSFVRHVRSTPATCCSTTKRSSASSVGHLPASFATSVHRLPSAGCAVRRCDAILRNRSDDTNWSPLRDEILVPARQRAGAQARDTAAAESASLSTREAIDLALAHGLPRVQVARVDACVDVT